MLGVENGETGESPSKAPDTGNTGRSVLDIGSLDINGNYRDLFEGHEYVGLDIQSGANVDVVVDPWDWSALECRQFDIIISGQCLEHSQYPWRTARLMLDHCKPDGWLAITAPSRQSRHNYPSDYFRFFETGLESLFEGRIDVVEGGTNKGLHQDDAWILARPASV